MKYEKLAEKMKYYKEDEEGGKKMCDKLQAIWDRHEPEILAKAEAKTKREFATRLLKSSKMSKTEISLMADLKLSEVEAIAKELEDK